MAKRLFFSIVAVGVGALLACGSDDADADDNADDAAPGDAGSASPLLGRTFLSESVTEDGEPRTLLEGTRIEITFGDDGRINLNAGCNSIGGPVAIGAHKLVVDELSSTAAGCIPDELHEQDEWLSGILHSDPTYVLDGDRLRLESAGSVIEMLDRTVADPDPTVVAPDPTVADPNPTVADPDRPLDGTTWQLDGIVTGDAASSLVQGTGATLVFRDGRVEVSIEGCNQGSAAVTIGETEIEAGPLAMTRMACPPDITTVETAVTTVLDGTITYTIEASSLTLTHPSGNGLTLTAAE